MTIEEASKLSDEQLRVRIAEFCGWKASKNEIRFMDGPNGEHASYISGLPDYPKDLNAMHGAILKLGREHWTDYTMHLRQVIVAECEAPEFYVYDDTIADIWFYNATARQRAIALVATIS